MCKATDLYGLMFRDYPDVLEVKDLQSMLGIGRHQVYGLITSGQIDGVKLGKTYKVPKIGVIEYLISGNQAN